MSDLLNSRAELRAQWSEAGARLQGGFIAVDAVQKLRQLQAVLKALREVAHGQLGGLKAFWRVGEPGRMLIRWPHLDVVGEQASMTVLKSRTPMARRTLKHLTESPSIR